MLVNMRSMWASTKDFVTAATGGHRGTGRRLLALARALTGPPGRDRGAAPRARTPGSPPGLGRTSACPALERGPGVVRARLPLALAATAGDTGRLRRSHDLGGGGWSG